MAHRRVTPEPIRKLRRAAAIAAACVLGHAACASSVTHGEKPLSPSAEGRATLGDSVLPPGVQPAARRAWMARQSALCLVAVADATLRYRLPPGLLGAVSRVETGRPLPVTGDRQPWPWTVNADGASLFFDTRAQAMAETQRVLAHGAQFVDIGCMQVDLREHRDAFATLQDAFNPQANTDYAARLLVSLRSGKRGADRGWAAASGLYHSGTPGLMEPYQAQVAHMRATQRNSLSD
jgi:hypothetical protein